MNSDRSAVSLSGIMNDNSTEFLHNHPYHQVLIIRDGVSLLIDEMQKQPLYGNMCVFIPAGFLHRSIVVGTEVTYQSLYFKKELFKAEKDGIIFFNISDLGIALFNRLNQNNLEDLGCGVAKSCLSLFFQILSEDIENNVFHMQLPIPLQEENKKIINYIEKNFQKKFQLSDFQSILPYSSRHITRIFSQDLKISIFQYIRLYRIFMASVLLHQKKRKIIDVAYSVGYESLSSFYTDFDKYFSLTPKDFRNRLNIK